MSIKLLLLVWVGVALIDTVLAIGLLLRWDEAIYRRGNGSGATWMVLDLLGIPRIHTHCTTVVRVYFLGGMIVFTLGGLAALFSYLHHSLSVSGLTSLTGG